ncbi:MAG: DUF72 domain-containing protein [Candidatus Eremiobacteraeota bacterium]|nr:DUF72 domain-containing protein [Candidatus Eremiobacteraeota bacterium]
MIYIGTCGYAYKDWIGIFYPGKIKSSEMLGYYAQRFRAVEIDASYYGVPSIRTVESMHARTPDDFRFSFKAPSTLTHPAGAYTQIHDDAGLFAASLRPLLAAGKLGGVLLQFPNGFKPSPQNETYLERLCATCEGLPLVAEFRHHDWQTPHTLELLSSLQVGWCNVDMPELESLMLPSSDATSPTGYVRFHGRNRAQWWSGTNITRYQYTYTPQELAPWGGRIAEIDEQTKATFAFFNNHARGGAARNAEMLLDLLENHYGHGADASIALPPRGLSEQPGLPGLTLS